MAALLDRWWCRAAAGAALLSALVGLVVLAVLLFGSATDQRILVTFLINLVAVVGLQTYVGNSGVISFGHAGFVALGAYGAALFTASPTIKARAIADAPAFILEAQFDFLPATVIGMAVAMAFAFAVGLTIVRLAGAAAAVATLGLMVVVYTVLSNAEGLTRGAKAFSGIPAYTTPALAFACLLVCFFAARLLRDSGLGLGLRSSREDELAAESSGVDILRARLVMWVASAAMCALAGSLYAHYLLAILPHAFHFGMTLLLVTMVIIGGQSISGALFGTAAVTLLAEALRRLEYGFSIGPISLNELPGLTTIVLGLLIVLTLTFRPKGLLGRWEIDELLLRAWRGRLPAPAREPQEMAPQPQAMRH